MEIFPLLCREWRTSASDLQVESGEGSRFVRINSAHSTLRYFVPINLQSLTSNSQPLISHFYYVIDGFGVGGDGEGEGFVFGLLEWEFLGGAEH